jgi:hypothetical protein
MTVLKLLSKSSSQAQSSPRICSLHQVPATSDCPLSPVQGLGFELTHTLFSVGHTMLDRSPAVGLALAILRVSCRKGKE